MIIPTSREILEELIPPWARTAIILVIFVLAVTCVIDPVLRLIFSPAKKADIHAQPPEKHPDQGKRIP